MRAAWALLACLLALPAAAQDAAAWLQRMASALDSLDYQGELVYSHGGQIESLRVYRAAGPDGGRERLISLNGPPREVVRSAGRVVCIGTSARPAEYGAEGLAPSLSSRLPGADASRLEAHYVLALGGTERVADHLAQAIELRPRDAFRFGYRLWLERESGMLLKSVRFGADGRTVEQLMFTRIALGQRPTQAELGGEVAMPAVPLPVGTNPAPVGSGVNWRLDHPPAGFEPDAVQPSAIGRVDHRLYSDGLAHVSVYLEPLSHAPAFSGAASRGAVNLHGRVVDGLQITVLGDVPPATVERFAQAVTLPGRD